MTAFRKRIKTNQEIIIAKQDSTQGATAVRILLVSDEVPNQQLKIRCLQKDSNNDLTNPDFETKISVYDFIVVKGHTISISAAGDAAETTVELDFLNVD